MNNKCLSLCIYTKGLVADFRVFVQQSAAMGFKHLVIVRFKEGTVVADIMKALEKLVSDVDLVKTFAWGEDLESPEMLTQGFTHAISMTFDKKQDYTAFQTHPSHVEFSATFSAAIEKIVVLCFSSVQVKPAIA